MARFRLQLFQQYIQEDPAGLKVEFAVVAAGTMVAVEGVDSLGAVPENFQMIGSSAVTGVPLVAVRRPGGLAVRLSSILRTVPNLYAQLHPSAVG